MLGCRHWSLGRSGVCFSEVNVPESSEKTRCNMLLLSRQYESHFKVSMKLEEKRRGCDSPWMSNSESQSGLVGMHLTCKKWKSAS